MENEKVIKQLEFLKSVKGNGTSMITFLISKNSNI